VREKNPFAVQTSGDWLIQRPHTAYVSTILNDSDSSDPRSLCPFSFDLLCNYHQLSDAQFTNLRNLTLFTNPSIRKTDHVFDPPELIRGSGIPAIGIRPTTIPTLTST
jgi:hypothetical protein